MFYSRLRNISQLLLTFVEAQILASHRVCHCCKIVHNFFKADQCQVKIHAGSGKNAPLGFNGRQNLDTNGGVRPRHEHARVPILAALPL